jgi:hypothetical protein
MDNGNMKQPKYIIRSPYSWSIFILYVFIGMSTLIYVPFTFYSFFFALLMLIVACFFSFKFFLVSDKMIKLKTLFYSREVKWEDVKEIHFCASVNGYRHLVIKSKQDKNLAAYWDDRFKEDYMKFFAHKDVVLKFYK